MLIFQNIIGVTGLNWEILLNRDSNILSFTIKYDILGPSQNWVRNAQPIVPFADKNIRTPIMSSTYVSARSLRRESIARVNRKIFIPNNIFEYLRIENPISICGDNDIVCDPIVEVR